MADYKKLVQRIADTQCVSYMLTGNEKYEKNEQRCGCVVHLARQMLNDGRVLYPAVSSESHATEDGK